MPQLLTYTIYLYALSAVCIIFFYLWNSLFCAYGKDISAFTKFIKQAEPNPAKLPLSYQKAFKSYRDSKGQLPSQSFSFLQRRQSFRFLSLPLVCILCCLIDCAFCAYYQKDFALHCVCTAVILFLTALTIFFLRESHRKTENRAERLFQRMLIYMDLYFGRSGEKQGFAVCGETDELTEKISFLKKSGINEVSANKIAKLVSQAELNENRTVAQQRKLNDALNGLLLVISKKEEEGEI